MNGSISSGSVSAPQAAPGAAWGALTLPLEIDPFTYAGVSLTNTAVLQQFAGTLDAAGSATAVVVLPPVLAAAVIGQRFTFAAYGLEPSGAPFVTPFSELVIRP